MAKDAEKLEAQGQRIRELRALARVSQEKAAYEIGVSVRGYREWELGHGGLNDDNIKSLARYFGTTPDYVEYGVMDRRKRGETPDLSMNGLKSQVSQLQDQIEQLSEQVGRLELQLERLTRKGYFEHAQEVLDEIKRGLDQWANRQGREVGRPPSKPAASPDRPRRRAA